MLAVIVEQSKLPVQGPRIRTGARRDHKPATSVVVRRRRLFVVASVLAVAIAPSTACKPKVASADECEKVAAHLADLQIKKEKTPPLGHLIPPFDDPDHEQSLREEAHDNAKQRCLKGWKREVYDCMMQATDIGAADKCRYL